MRPARSWLAFLAAGLGAAAPAAAPPAQATANAPSDLAGERKAIAAFQTKDQRLQDVGWKLARGNAEFCDQRVPAIGLQLQDLASYSNPRIARAALRLKGDFAVQTAARGSPAALSGQFTRNREIVGFGSASLNTWEAREKSDWRRLARAHDAMDAVLAKQGSIKLRFADGLDAALTAQTICKTRFELAGRNSKAVADGTRVVVGARFVGFSYPEEIFAGAIAHELAHNLLGHRAWLDRNKRKRRHVRLTEREADRLMPWLMANAGYDPRAAVTFMETWGPRHDGGLFRARTHDGWDERAEFIAAELTQITQLIESTGKADWRAHFRREIDPGKGL